MFFLPHLSIEGLSILFMVRHGVFPSEPRLATDAHQNSAQTLWLRKHSSHKAKKEFGPLQSVQQFTVLPSVPDSASQRAQCAEQYNENFFNMFFLPSVVSHNR